MKMTHPWIRAGAFGLLCFGLLLLSTAIGTKLVESGTISMTGTDALCYGLLALSAFGGCLLCALTAKKLLLPSVLLTGGVYFLLLCVMNGVLQRGAFQRLLPTAGTVLAAALFASVCGALKQKGSFSKVY